MSRPPLEGDRLVNRQDRSGPEGGILTLVKRLKSSLQAEGELSEVIQAEFPESLLDSIDVGHEPGPGRVIGANSEDGVRGDRHFPK
jgi:hypothetical protein